jgi:hypothetical protein
MADIPNGGGTGKPMTIDEIIALIRSGGVQLGGFDPRIPQLDANRAFQPPGSKFSNQALPIVPTVPYSPDETSPRPVTIRGERPQAAPIPMPVPRPADNVPAQVSRPQMAAPVERPAADDSVSRALWTIYNESESPADFLRADAAMRAGRAEGGRLLPDDYPTSYMPDVGRQVMADGGEASTMGGFMPPQFEEPPDDRGERFQRALQNYRNFPQQRGEATAQPLGRDVRDVIGGAIAGDQPNRSYGTEMRRRAADLIAGSTGMRGSGTLGFGIADAPLVTGLPLMASDIAGSAGRGDYAEAALGALLPAAFYARKPIGKALGVARDALGRVPAPVAAGATGAAVMSPEEAEAIKLRLPKGMKQIIAGTPENDMLKAQEAYERIVSPFSNDPESVQRALQIASTYRIPQGAEFGTGSFFKTKPSMGVTDVQANIAPLPGVTPLDPKQMSWEDFAKQAKGGTMINVGGDRMNLGLLRDINNEGRLAWDVPLHAGPKYMLEPNPGMVWANAPGHTTSFNRIIANAAKEGPVYGVYAPMGPTAVDSSVDMFNAVMSQLPTSKISKSAAKSFDEMVRNADFVSKVEDRPRVAEIMKSQWPGLSNLKTPEEVMGLAQNLTGSQRGDLVKAMEKASWRKQGFPDIGTTRVAVTDPALLSAPSNTIGHRVVRFDTEGLIKPERKFAHPSYPAESLGTYVGDVPLVQTQYGMPTAMDKLLAARTKKGEVMHPYSIDPMGRSSARKMFTEQKQVQPVDDRLIESIMMGLERQKKYGLKKGGSVSHRALMLASSNT